MTRPRATPEEARKAVYEVGIIATILQRLANASGQSVQIPDIGPEVEWLAQRLDAAHDVLMEVVG